MGTSNTPTNGGTSDEKRYGHGSRESDVAHVIGAYAGEDKARDERANAQVRETASPIDGEPATIDGETIDQMRKRVARERAEADPTPFQRSLTGRRPTEVQGIAGTTLPGNPPTSAGGVSGAASGAAVSGSPSVGVDTGVDTGASTGAGTTGGSSTTR